MLDPAVYTWRLQAHCHGCEWWAGRCRKGHLVTSPEGCPVYKFPPVEAAGYAPDIPPMDISPAEPCSSCGSTLTGDLPDLSWHQVLTQFGAAMLKWVANGAPLVNEQAHAERLTECKSNVCGRLHGFWCLDCRCVVYIKTKLATEECPKKRWLRKV